MKHVLKILLLGNATIFGKRISLILKSGGIECEIFPAEDKNTFESLLNQHKFNLAFCDYNIQGCNGISSLKTAHLKQPGLPIIIFSEELGDARAVECIKAGATDYILKKDFENLLPKVELALKEARKRRNELDALRESEAKYRSIIRDMQDVFYRTDKEGKIILASPSGAAMLGIDNVEEIYGQNVKDYYAGANERDQFLKALMEKGRVRDYEVTLKKKDGTLIYITTNSHFYFDHKSQVAGIEGVFHDISERKHAEKEKEILQSQLHHARKMESIGRLAGGVAHDFNNMLSVIIGNADLCLTHENISGSCLESIQEIIKASHRSANLTRQLLALARKQTSVPTVLNLNDAVSGMLKMLKRLISENIELAWIPHQELWNIHVDPSHIDQILANLTVNASDAISETGKITLKTVNTRIDGKNLISMENYAPGKYVMLSMQDTGKGMEKEILDHIFEPFFTTKQPGKGTGLGLATVYGIVRQNNGFINVRSSPGKGTTFEIYLPCHDMIPAQISDKTIRGEMKGGTETLLVVEDEDSMLTLLKKILQNRGYRVIPAQNPSQAMKHAEEFDGEIHLLLTDVILPQMNGKGLSDRINIIRPGIRRLFMSGYPADVITRQGIIYEDLNFIQKPFDEHTLISKIRETLDRAS